VWTAARTTDDQDKPLVEIKDRLDGLLTAAATG
jgi:hypothetical protein